MNIFKSAGVAVGVLVGLVIAFLLARNAHSDHRFKTEYDERQNVIRGRAYKYAFYTVLFYELIMLILNIGEVSWPLPEYIFHFIGALLGCVVLAVYSIWTNVYWGINESKKRYIPVLAVCFLLNILPVVMAVRAGDLVKDGKPGTAMINLLVLVMLGIVLATMILKAIVDRTSGEEEE